MILNPKVEVECDGCGYFESFGLTPLAREAWDGRDLGRQMEAYGWKTVGDDEHLCEECAKPP